MRKILLFAAAIATVWGANAQVSKTVAEVCNYLDIQAEATTLSATVPTSTVSVASSNGSVFWGYSKSDGSEAAMQWNVKDEFNTSLPMPDLTGTLDTLVVGTMYRAASGGHIDLGSFTTTAAGKISVYFQPNGDSERGLSIKGPGGLEATKLGSGVKLGNNRPGYAAELTIPATSYAAGDIVITVVTNTCNIFGVNIENLQTKSGINSLEISNSISFNGAEIINKQGLNLSVYNMLGKMVRTSNANVNMTDLQSGIYVVRAEGVKGALKISK